MVEQLAPFSEYFVILQMRSYSELRYCSGRMLEALFCSFSRHVLTEKLAANKKSGGACFAGATIGPASSKLATRDLECEDSRTNPATIKLLAGIIVDMQRTKRKAVID